MANNQYVNKVIYGNDTIIDISQDTVTAEKILSGYTAHDATGASITGSCTGVQIPVPITGTNSFWIAVPNGTANPDPNDDDDWIKLIFTVDTTGNSDITEDATNAYGVSY